MGNIMTSIYTGVSGIQSNQAGLNVVSHNLANINTEGYVRQQALGKDTHYDTLGNNRISSLQVGYGGTIDAIRQVRSVFLDKSYRIETGRKEFYEEQCKTAEEIEGIFGEISGEKFSENISDFWTAVQELSKEPDSIVKRSALVSRSVTMTERATAISDALARYQQNQNTKIADQVVRVNEIGHEISALNTRIVQYETDGQNANDLRDTRNILLDELSGIVKNRYEENPLGSVSVSIEGRQFVSDSNVFEMDIMKSNDAQQLIHVIWDDGRQTPVFDMQGEYISSNDSNVGGLKGLLVARGEKKGSYIDIPVREKYSDDITYQKAVDVYNKDVESSMLVNAQAQFDQLIHGIVTGINDILCPNVTAKNYLESINASTVAPVTIDDGGVVSTVDLSKDDILLWDEYNASVGMDTNKTPREALFERKYMERYREGQLTYTDSLGAVQTKKVYIYNKEDETDLYSQFTLGQIEVNENIQKEVSKLPLNGTTNNGLEGAYDVTNCNKLTDLFEEKFAALSPNEITKHNFTDYYIAMTGSIAALGNAYDRMSKSQADMTADLDNQRQTIMGVASEEELTNMLKYQWAYSASSKYMNVINELLETVINTMR